MREEVTGPPDVHAKGMASDAHSLAAPLWPIPQKETVPRASDPGANRLAEMLVAAVLDGEWAHLDHALTSQHWQDQLVPLIDRLCERLPRTEQQQWRHRQAAGLVGTVANALVRERDGTAAQERRRQELNRLLVAEHREVAAGLYPPPPGDRPRLALVIVCGASRNGRGNQCGAERARAFTVPHRKPGDPVLIMRNVGSMDRPHRLEAIVPPDFSGATDVVYGYENPCVRGSHNTLHLNGALIRGGAQMPFFLLRKPYERFSDPKGSGKPLRVPWTPGAFPTIYRGQPVESHRQSH